MSVKFEVNFESLFERLGDYTVIDDINAKTFYNTFSRRDNYRDEFSFEIINLMMTVSRLSFYFWFRLSTYSVHSKTKLIYRELS